MHSSCSCVAEAQLIGLSVLRMTLTMFIAMIETRELIFDEGVYAKFQTRRTEPRKNLTKKIQWKKLC